MKRILALALCAGIALAGWQIGIRLSSDALSMAIGVVFGVAYNPEDPESLRRQYVDMRIESNDNYDNAHALLGLAAATRIISVIQSFWLVRRESRREGLQLQPMRYGGFGSGLRLTWSF